MRRGLTREMSVFFGQNKRAVVVYRKNKITPLFFFFYTEIRTVSLMLLSKNTLSVYNINKLASVRNNYRKIEWQTYYPTVVF